MEAIHTSTHDDSSGIANEISDKMRDLSIRVNPKVTEEVVHHAGL
jgi:hypothetical protein